MNVIPKGIQNHAGVEEVCLDYDGYEYRNRADVLLKDDWHFAGLDQNSPYTDTHNKRRTGFFYTLREFKAAQPAQYTEEEMKTK